MGSAQGNQRCQGKEIKDSHVGVGGKPGNPLWTDVPYAIRNDGSSSVRTLTLPDKRPPLSRRGSRLAILVHQGSDPTQPYPTLVIRDRAPRFRRLCALATLTTLFGTLARIVAMWDQTPLIREMLPGSPPIWPRLRGGFRSEAAVRLPAVSGPEPIPLPGRSPPRHAPYQVVDQPRHRGSS